MEDRTSWESTFATGLRDSGGSNKANADSQTCYKHCPRKTLLGMSMHKDTHDRSSWVIKQHGNRTRHNMQSNTCQHSTPRNETQHCKTRLPLSSLGTTAECDMPQYAKQQQHTKSTEQNCAQSHADISNTQRYRAPQARQKE